MFTQAWRACGTAALALMLTACAPTIGQQVLRHLVIVELMERDQVPESYISIEDIRMVQEQALVRATVRGHGGRLGSVRTYRCELERAADRWVLRSVQAY